MSVPRQRSSLSEDGLDAARLEDIDVASTSVVGPEGSDGKQFGALWEASALSRGAAATVHGEVIRIARRRPTRPGATAA